MWIRVYLIVGALLLGSCQGASAGAAETATPGVGAYMPLVFRQPMLTPSATPTPQPTPTPEPTPAPHLEDGYYKGDVVSPGDGWIWFEVADGGTRVVDAGVLVKSGAASWCIWESLAFEGSAKIENGEFTYWSMDPRTREIFGCLHCQSWASWWTVCAAKGFGSWYYCGVNRVVVVRR